MPMWFAGHRLRPVSGHHTRCKRLICLAPQTRFSDGDIINLLHPPPAMDAQTAIAFMASYVEMLKNRNGVNGTRLLDLTQTWQERVDCKMALGSLRTCWWELMRGAIRKDMLKKYGAPLWATIEVILRSGGGSRERMQRALNLVRASLS